MDRDGRVLNVLFLLGIFVGIGYCLYHLSAASSDPRENQLLSALLTILSIIGSWVASRYYSESSYNKNLRLFALKAAEKVTTLSSELDRLTASLQEDLKSSDYDTPSEEILAKNFTIENAIYAIRTLKSINDGSLSDWRGVIGAEIDAKREDQEEREHRLQELVERVAFVSEKTTNQFPADSKPVESENLLRADLDTLKEDLRVLAAQVSGLPLRHTGRPINKKEAVTKNCPICQYPVLYRQRNKLNSIKQVICKKCRAKLYSIRIENDYSLRERVPLAETFQCPSCSHSSSIRLDPVPGASEKVRCPGCDNLLIVVRRASDLRIAHAAEGMPIPAESITEGFLEEVRVAMGQQPWPQGRSRQVQSELSASGQGVHLAVQELVRRGVFMLQQNGKLYRQVPDRAADGTDKN